PVACSLMLIEPFVVTRPPLRILTVPAPAWPIDMPPVETLEPDPDTVNVPLPPEAVPKAIKLLAPPEYVPPFCTVTVPTALWPIWSAEPPGWVETTDDPGPSIRTVPGPWLPTASKPLSVAVEPLSTRSVPRWPSVAPSVTPAKPDVVAPFCSCTTGS